MSEFIALLLWYVWMQVFALAGWAVAAPWLGRADAPALADRGYGISKALGMLLSGYAYWLSVSVGLSRNNTGAVILALVLVLGVGLALNHLRPNRPSDIAFFDDIRAQYSLRQVKPLIITEAIFLAAFLLCAIYRAYNPNIETAGGEKFMETMMLNAILRSPSFPPNDAWLSGFSISYYYFGYVLQAMHTLVSGVPSSIAFNLSGATTFALAVVGAFSVGYNLWSAHKVDHGQGLVANGKSNSPKTKHQHPKSPVVAGLVTAFMLAFMGNLGGAIESGRCAGTIAPSTIAWLDIKNLNKDTPIECNGLRPTRFYWWWTWSRTVHDYSPNGGDQEAITEFPAFSFMLGDNHPHVMNLPFVLLALSLALWVWQGGLQITQPDGATTKDGAVTRLYGPKMGDTQIRIDLTPTLGVQSALLAIIIGGLSFMNTWDLPIFGGLILGALVLRHWLNGQTIASAVAFSAVIFVLAYLLYVPFYSTFASQARGIGVNLFNGTRFPQFFIMFAPFVVLIPAFLLLAMEQLGRDGTATRLKSAAHTKDGSPTHTKDGSPTHTKDGSPTHTKDGSPTRLYVQGAGLLVGFLALCVVGMVVLGFVSPPIRNLLDELNRTGSAMGVPRATVESRAWARLSDPWVPLYLLGSVALVVVMINEIKRLGARNAPQTLNVAQSANQPTSQPLPFILLLLGAGALLAASVEFVFLLDNFGTRMNSIFKFYYQSWVLWSVVGAYAFMVFVQSRQVAHRIIAGLAGVLMALGLLYPIYTAYSRTDDFKRTPTLDGAAYLRQFHTDDAKVIDWFNNSPQSPLANAQATPPRIAEAPGDKGKSYAYEGRIATFTGLPTLLGWGGHQSQWRGNYNEAGRREPLIENFFNGTDPAETKRIARDLQIQYVIIGQTELKRYSPEGIAKFAQLGQEVFRSGDTVVYRMK
ncbi:MAG: DUF2298 domain-containing protein [Anaerolineae bacterium]|nr:DUF2298 domain-containing protein [Anaerolineae bacterium]